MIVTAAPITMIDVHKQLAPAISNLGHGLAALRDANYTLTSGAWQTTQATISTVAAASQAMTGAELLLQTDHADRASMALQIAAISGKVVQESGYLQAIRNQRATPTASWQLNERAQRLHGLRGQLIDTYTRLGGDAAAFPVLEPPPAAPLPPR